MCEQFDIFDVYENNENQCNSRTLSVYNFWWIMRTADLWNSMLQNEKPATEH